MARFLLEHLRHPGGPYGQAVDESGGDHVLTQIEVGVTAVHPHPRKVQRQSLSADGVQQTRRAADIRHEQSQIDVGVFLVPRRRFSGDGVHHSIADLQPDARECLVVQELEEAMELLAGLPRKLAVLSERRADRDVGITRLP